MTDDPGREVPTGERDRLRALWRDTRLLSAAGSNHWQPWAPEPGTTMLVITAWNPDACAASADDNARADARLHDDVSTLDPQRIRGAGDGWHEDGWAFPHEPGRSLALIRRHRQVAGWVVTAAGRRLLWRDGDLDEA
jgi:hypothetical protein